MFKSSIINVRTFVQKTLWALGNYISRYSVNLEINTADLKAKWYYQKRYMIGTVSDITTAMRTGSELPVREVYVASEGLDTTFIYDPYCHSVKQVNTGRLFKTKEEALDRVRLLVENWNDNKVSIEIKCEADTKKEHKPVNKSKNNAKKHAKHDKKVIVKDNKNTKNVKKTLSKKKAIVKKGNK